MSAFPHGPARPDLHTATGGGLEKEKRFRGNVCKFKDACSSSYFVFVLLLSMTVAHVPSGF